MGKKDVPDAAYYGVQTVRALENFRGKRKERETGTGPRLCHDQVRRSQNEHQAWHFGGKIKGKAIERAARRIIDGEFI